MHLICPFCKRPVDNENSAIHGCDACIEKWATEQNVDHPVD